MNCWPDVFGEVMQSQYGYVWILTLATKLPNSRAPGHIDWPCVTWVASQSTLLGQKWAGLFAKTCKNVLADDCGDCDRWFKLQGGFQV